MGRLFQVIVKAEKIPGWWNWRKIVPTLLKDNMESSVTVAEWPEGGGEREATEESDPVGPSTPFNVNKWGV